MLKLWDFECMRCGHMWEELIPSGEKIARCPIQACGRWGYRQPFTQGTAARAQVNPAKTREMFGKAQEMRNKVTGKTPWRRSSHSQTGNE